MSKALNLTICVVLYRSAEISRRFAREIVASLSDHTEWQLIFYDNSPTDELADLAAFGEYRHDNRNRGFSFANNQIILAARYPNLAIINPDVFGFTPALWEALSEQALGRREARFIRLLNEDGTPQDCVGQVSSLTRAARRQPDYASERGVVPVGMGIMAFMLTTREVIAEVGLLDCDYPLYAEDMDWCFRAGQAGVPVLYDARFELTHIGGASAKDRWSHRKTLKRKYGAERLFIDKHYRGLHWFAMRWLNAVKQLNLR